MSSSTGRQCCSSTKAAAAPRLLVSEAASRGHSPLSHRSLRGAGQASVLSVVVWALSQRFATGAGEIAWDRLGRGPPVVLVHGTPWSSWTWRSVAGRLAESFTVYVF